VNVCLKCDRSANFRITSLGGCECEADLRLVKSATNENSVECAEDCGDGKLLNFTKEHTCDDGNLLDFDGCSTDCKIE
jgi:cysteine-rich repeat protein